MDPVYLNLNGHSITLTGKNTEVIRLKGTTNSGSYRMMQTTLHIYDNKTDTSTTGKITHASGFTGNGINVGRNAHLYMHGGEISGNNGNYGGGVYLFKSANLHMEGGTIKNNTAYEGGGVYLEDATCNVRFSGTFQIVDNLKKGTTNTENNLYLPWGSMLDLYHSSNIDSSSTVRITTQAKPTSTITTEGVRLWKDRQIAINNVFGSDDMTYTIYDDGKNGYLTFNQSHEFKVHFETNGGDTQLDDKSVAPTSKVPEPTITKTGYRFDGWYTDSGFTKPYNFDSPVLSDLTLYAKWIPNTYRVTFDSNGETQTRDVVYDTTYGELPTPIYPGHKFCGWYTAATGGTEITSTSIVKITVPTTLYAKWEERSFVVKWANDDGTLLETDENVSYGTIPTYEGTTPAKNEDDLYTYTFKEWNPKPAAIISDMTYVATYTSTPKTYTVTWKIDDEHSLTQESVTAGTMPTYPGSTPEKAATSQYSYTFDSWFPAVTAVTSDVTYTAVFTESVNKYKITFVNEDNEDESVLQELEVEYGQFPVYSGKVPTKQGDEHTYVFTGWDPAITTVTKDTTYRAVFSTVPPTQYTVTFEDGFGNVLSTKQYDADTSAEQIVKPNVPSVGTEQYLYEFERWNPAVSAVTSDVIYVAQFERTIKNYTINWVDGDGTTRATENLPFGTVLQYKGETPTKADDVTNRRAYIFNGTWSSASTQRMDVVRRDETFTANFDEKNYYTITWKNENGTVLETDDKVIAGTTPEYNGETPTTTKAGYQFAGWDKPISMAVKDETYTAVFKAPEEYVIRIVYPNGTEQTIVKKYGEKIAEPASTGIERFEGWYDQDGNVFDFNTEIKNNLVLTAKQYEYRYTPDSSFTWVLGTSANQIATVKRFVGETVSGKDGTVAFDTYQSFLDNGSQLYVDDTRLKENDEFIHEEGSLIVTLSADMLNSLSVGTHRLRAVFRDGYADLMFNVINENDPIPAAPEAPHTDNVVTCQMAGFPANYEWNEAAKACQPGYLDESGVFHSTSFRKAAVNTYDKGLEGNKISFVTAMISSFIAAYLLMKFD